MQYAQSFAKQVEVQVYKKLTRCILKSDPILKGLPQRCQLLKIAMREISLIEKFKCGRFTVASFFVTFL